MGKLVQNIPFLCFNCHSNFLKKFKCVHLPVATGNCPQCHSPHRSEEKKLLTRKGQDVCLYCHKSAEVFATKTHSDNKEKNCIECHNPHGGKDEALLRPEIYKKLRSGE